MPPCYVVLTDLLEPQQFDALAQMLFFKWFPECESLEIARLYMLDGLPLKTTHFNGCGSDDFHMMKWGAALNAAMHRNFE